MNATYIHELLDERWPDHIQTAPPPAKFPDDSARKTCPSCGQSWPAGALGTEHFPAACRLVRRLRKAATR